jgi:hypothetical protein
MGETLRWLVRQARQAGQEATEDPGAAGGVQIHAVYGGVRTDGVYDPATTAVTITSGPLAGATYSRPSGAAIAVVQLSNRTVNPNRNGWSFWIVSSTGERLQTIRHPGKS